MQILCSQKNTSYQKNVKSFGGLKGHFEDFSSFSLKTDRYSANGHYQTSYLYSKRITHDRLRSCTRSFLRSLNEDYTHWVSVRESFFEIFAEALVDRLGLVDNEFTLKRTNFLQCNSTTQNAFVVGLSDGSNRVVVPRCGNKYCPVCRDRKREKQVQDIISVIKELSLKGVIKRVWRFQVTFPDDISKRAIYDSDLRNTLITGAVMSIRRVFGLRSRDNIGVVVYQHVVGDLDFFKDRWHLHIVVIPALFSGGRFVPCDVDGMIDVAELRSLLVKYYGFDLINPQVRYEYCKYRSSKGVFWNKRLFRALRYDARGFGNTFFGSVLRFDMFGCSRVLVRSDYYDGGYRYLGYRIVTLEQLVDRWIWLCDNMGKVRLFGWLGRYKKIFSGVMDMKEYTMDDVVSVRPVKLFRYRRKIYDKNLGKVVWDVKEEIELDGKRYKVGKDIEEVYIKGFNCNILD